MELKYGQCPCGGTYQKRSVQITMTVNAKPVQLDDVPQGACPQCGSRIYKALLLDCIESVMKQNHVLVRLQ